MLEPELQRSSKSVLRSATFIIPDDTSVYDGKASLSLGVVQIVMGIHAICTQGLLTWLHSLTLLTGAGFFGFFCALAGMCGIIAGKRKEKEMIIAYLVSCIVCWCFSLVMIGVPIAAFNFDPQLMKENYTNRGKDHVPYLIASYALNALLLLCGAILWVTFVWGAGIVCVFICCNHRTGVEADLVFVLDVPSRMLSAVST